MLKKITAILLVLLVISAGLVACGNDEPDTGDSSESISNVESPDESENESESESESESEGEKGKYGDNYSDKEDSDIIDDGKWIGPY